MILCECKGCSPVLILYNASCYNHNKSCYNYNVSCYNHNTSCYKVFDGKKQNIFHRVLMFPRSIRILAG